MKRWLIFVFALLFLLVLTACGNDSSNEDPPTESDGTTEEGPESDVVEDEADTGEDAIPPAGSEATDSDEEGPDEQIALLTVELMNSDGDSVGTAELTEADKGVHVALDAEELETGTYGIQFHEEGKCEAPEFDTAGDPYAAELPQIEVGEDGTVTEEFTAEDVTLKSGEENSLLQEGGTSLVIYSQEDNSERIACGVVTTEQ